MNGDPFYAKKSKLTSGSQRPLLSEQQSHLTHRRNSTHLRAACGAHTVFLEEDSKCGS